MSPNELSVDLTTSYAQRTGGTIRVVLGLDDSSGAGPSLRLRSRKRVATAVIEPGSTPGTVEARVANLPPGVWRLSLGTEEGDAVPLEARLVAVRKQPVALLPGPRPATKMAPPQPREVPVPKPSTARRIASRTVDSALVLLPEQRRRPARARLARLGRRILR